MLGSTAGTTAGTLGEQALTGQNIFSGETGAKLLSNVLENAAFDVAGNLTFTLAGKGYQIGKDALSKAGVQIGGLMGAFSPEEQARKAKYIMEIEREWRELDKIKLLIEIE